MVAGGARATMARGNEKETAADYAEHYDDLHKFQAERLEWVNRSMNEQPNRRRIKRTDEEYDERSRESYFSVADSIPMRRQLQDFELWRLKLVVEFRRHFWHH